MRRKIIFILITILFLFNFSFEYAFADSNNGKSSEIVMEVTSGRILSSTNANQKMFMASTTKILTAICVIENCNINEIVTIKKEWCGIEGSSIYLKDGEKLKVIDLLYGLMLRSGNDTAVALACYTKGNIDDFALLMNETAIKIGANNSNFTNPHGLHDDNHYTTALDLAKITCYALNNPTFANIVATKKITIENSNGYRRVLINKNKMLSTYPDSIGVKTGYTKKAGKCLVSAINYNGLKAVCVILNCPQTYERTYSLFNNAKNEYSMQKIVNHNEIIDFIPVENRKNPYNKSGLVECAVGVFEDIILPISKKDEIKIEYDIEKSLKAPIKYGEEVGKIYIYSGNNLIFSQKIYTINDIE